MQLWEVVKNAFNGSNMVIEKGMFLCVCSDAQTVFISYFVEYIDNFRLKLPILHDQILSLFKQYIIKYDQDIVAAAWNQW